MAGAGGGGGDSLAEETRRGKVGLHNDVHGVMGEDGSGKVCFPPHLNALCGRKGERARRFLGPVSEIVSQNALRTRWAQAEESFTPPSLALYIVSAGRQGSMAIACRKRNSRPKFPMAPPLFNSRFHVALR